ncbi:MAG: nucleotidyltransferase family protein [Paenisporosarcina sp.]
MNLLNEQDLIELIATDEWMMNVLRHASTLELPDWWICAGFVRSKVWDTLHSFEVRTPLPDVDVIYFQSDQVDEENEKRLEGILKKMDPTIPWSVKNQARMHHVNQVTPYTSSTDGMSKFPETATAIGVTLDEIGELHLCAPYGVEDLLSMTIKPTSLFKDSQLFKERLVAKKWSAKWPNVKE